MKPISVQFNTPCLIKKNSWNSTAEGSNLVDAELQKPQILLVESDKELLAYLYKELKSSYIILRAENMEEAEQILLKNNIQLVIAEILSPEMQGIQLCERIKSDPMHCHIPMIFLTEQRGYDLKIEVLRHGADVCIEKPFSLEYLLVQIENLLFNRQMIREYFSNLSIVGNRTDLEADTSDYFLEKLYTIVEEHIAEADMTVDLLAELMHMSRPTLYRKVSKFSDLKPNEIIKLVKLEKAAELIMLRQFTVSQIASMVGYSEQSNFSRDFHKHFGLRPSNFINRMGNNFAS